MRSRKYCPGFLLGIGLASLMAAPAMAGAISSNYIFPDGSHGFSLIGVPAVQSGSPLIDPALLVEFNPQPDPPANLRTTLSLDDPTVPALGSPSTGNNFDFFFSFLNLGDPNLVSPGPCRVAPPDAVGLPPDPCRTSFSFDTTVGDVQHNFEVDLGFTNGGSNVVDQASWGAFNPQPDPPGDGLGIQFSYPGDPIMFFSVTEDGNLLRFAPVPEPGSLALLATGLAGLAMLRRRRRAA